MSELLNIERAVIRLLDAGRPAVEAAPEIGRAALELLRAIVRTEGAACRDPRGELIQLNRGYRRNNDGTAVVSAGALIRAAKDGSLPAQPVERGKLVAWESDIQRSIDSGIFAPERKSHTSLASAPDTTVDPAIAHLLSNGYRAAD